MDFGEVIRLGCNLELSRIFYTTDGSLPELKNPNLKVSDLSEANQVDFLNLFSFLKKSRFITKKKGFASMFPGILLSELLAGTRDEC